MIEGTLTDWSDVLARREQILWQGRPGTGLAIGPEVVRQSLMGLFFCAFAIYWMVMAAKGTAQLEDGPGELFPYFGLPFLAVGLYYFVGHLFWSAYVRRNSWYALTDTRALIKTRLFGSTSVKAWPIGPASPLELRQGQRATIWFAEAPISARNRLMAKKIGFEQIEDGAQVYRLFRTVRGDDA